MVFLKDKFHQHSAQSMVQMDGWMDVAAPHPLLGLFHRHRMRRFAMASCRGRGMQSGCARARILLDELFQATWPKSLQVYRRGCDRSFEHGSDRGIAVSGPVRPAGVVESVVVMEGGRQYDDRGPRGNAAEQV